MTAQAHVQPKYINKDMHIIIQIYIYVQNTLTNDFIII